MSPWILVVSVRSSVGQGGKTEGKIEYCWMVLALCCHKSRKLANSSHGFSGLLIWRLKGASLHGQIASNSQMVIRFLANSFKFAYPQVQSISFYSHQFSEVFTPPFLHSSALQAAGTMTSWSCMHPGRKCVGSTKYVTRITNLHWAGLLPRRIQWYPNQSTCAKILVSKSDWIISLPVWNAAWAFSKIPRHHTSSYYVKALSWWRRAMLGRASM